MLVIKESAGVALGMNLGNPLRTGDGTQQRGIHSGFRTMESTSDKRSANIFRKKVKIGYGRITSTFQQTRGKISIIIVIINLVYYSLKV